MKFNDMPPNKVKIIIGDIFNSKAQTLVNTVNCVGVMGKGLALEFKKRFPEMFDDYSIRCKKGEVRLGKPYLFKRLIPPWILLFPTKMDWRSLSKLSDIEEGLLYLKRHYKIWGITSLAVPPLGCGLGELNWDIVGPTLYRHLISFDIPVILYAPYGTPHSKLQPNFLGEPSDAQLIEHAHRPESRVEPGFIPVIEVLKRINTFKYHAPVGRTIFQKIAYFGTYSGFETGLNYERNVFGPFAPELKRKLTKLLNNGLLKEHKYKNMFIYEVGDTYNDAKKIYKQEVEANEEKIEKLVDLFCRFNNSKQVELAASVHYTYRELKNKKHEKLTENDILDDVMEWKKRRTPSFKKIEVANMIRNLAILSWMNIEPSENISEELESNFAF